MSEHHSQTEEFSSLESQEEPINSSIKIIERPDGTITETIVNYRQFMMVFLGNGDNGESRRKDRARELPVLEAEILFKDRMSGREIKFNDLLPMGWKIALSGDSLDRILQFPRLEDLPDFQIEGSFDGLRECAQISNDIKTIHYNALESHRTGLLEDSRFLDLCALLHEIGHAHQKETPLFIEMLRAGQEIHDFIQDNKPTRSGPFMQNQDSNNFIQINPAFFGIYGYRDSNGGFIPYSETVFLPHQLVELYIQKQADIEKDAHVYAMKKILELRKNGFNIEGDATIEEIFQFMISSLRTYNRAYSELIGHPVTAFTDGFEITRLTVEST